jgi:hypothetical protein
MVGVSGALLLNGIGRNVDANTDPSSPIVSNISSADSHTLINGNPTSNPSDTIHTITSSNTSTGPININDSYASGTNTLQSTNSFFHLSLFSLASGNTAIFSSGSNYSTNDIVWIDQTANIWGKVSADNNSNLYMFDPHGINFYNGSSVDVNGSFYISNASNVHLGYYANGLQRDGCFGQGCSQAIDKLTASNPIEFGFLGSETGNLTVHGATMNQFSEDTQIELVGTGIDISNSSISIANGGFQGWQTSLDSNSKVITDNQGNPILTPYADGLDIRLLSLAPNTSLDVPVNITNFHEADQAINNLTFSGNINISNSLLNAGGDGEQTIDIRGGGVSIDNQSTLISTNFGSDITRNSSGNDEVATDNSANVTSDLDEYTNEPDLDPNAKSINILATNQIDITSSKLLAWSSYDAAGSIQIQAPIISIDNSLIDTKAASANYISSSSLSPSDSNYMNNLDSILALNAINNNQNLIIDPKTNVISVYTPYDPTDHNYSIGSVISSFSSSSTAGAGDITINASNTLTVTNNSNITSSSYVNTNAGKIGLSSGNDLKITGSTIQTNILTNGLSTGGTAGDISISSKNGNITLDSTQVESNSLTNGVSGGNAGNITINTPGNLTISNSQKNPNSNISTNTDNNGKAGDITLAAASIKISDGKIQSNSKFGNSSAGQAGSINAKAISGDILLANSTLSTDILGGKSGGTRGDIILNAPGSITLDNSKITSDTSGGTDAGNIAINSSGSGSNIKLSNGSVISSSSNSKDPTAGSAGQIKVAVNQGALSLDKSNISTNVNGGSSSTSKGIINLSSKGAITLTDSSPVSSQTGSHVTADSSGGASAGDITLTSSTDNITLSDLSEVSTSSTSSGAAGSVDITSILGTINIDGKSKISSSNGTSATPGLINLSSANNISILGGSEINTSAVGGTAGNIGISTGNGAVVIDAATIHSDSKTGGTSGGSAGNIDISSPGALTISNGTISTTSDNNGSAGTIKLTSQGALSLNANTVSSSSTSSGSAGSIAISSILDTLTIAGKSTVSSSNGTSSTAGLINLNSANNISILGGSEVNTSAAGGKAGDIGIKTGNGAVVIDSATIHSDSTTNSGLSAGNIDINSPGALTINNAVISTTTNNNGDAGSINLASQSDLNIKSNSNITSSSTSTGSNAGKAGFIEVKTNTGNIQLSNSSLSTDVMGGKSGGSRGDIIFNTPGNFTLDNSTITAKTAGGSEAGAININTGTNGTILMANNSFLSTDTSGQGSAGTITTNSSKLNFNPGSYFSSSTSGQGSAGTVIVNTGDLTIQGAAPIPLDVLGKHTIDVNFTGIRSLATDKSTGQTGDITITETNDVNLINGAQISISNDGTASAGNTVSKHKIDLTAHSIFMKDSQILANSTGNVDASGININYSDQLNMDPSAISTSANTGNGGPINVYGGNMIWLQDSMIATSAVGGNGGPIDIRSNYIIPTNGFIQANTLANGGAGGTLNINTNALVPSESTLIQGGNILNFRPYSGINVIQASAPNGVGGALNITSPQLNLSGTLATILVQTIDPNALNQNMCAIDESSSLIMMGRGALHKRLDDGLISITVPHALDHQFD